jgi:asparagine synthase (glutamine-hydrolysing)
MHSYASPELEKRLDLARKIRQSGFDPTFKRVFAGAKSHPVAILDAGVLRLCYGAGIGCETGLELRDPTGDPRVIECALSIPDELFLGPMNKWVLRTMMKGKLPDEVRLNKRKGKQSSDLPARMHADRAAMDRILAEMEASGFGSVADLTRIRDSWQKLNADPDHFPLEEAFHLFRPFAAFLVMREDACAQGAGAKE